MRPVSYTWDNAMVEGRRRLALLEHSLDPSTFRRLEGIGVAPGWRCLDVGAGGTLFVEEPDAISVRTLDRSGFRSLSLRVFEIVQSRGSHPDWSRDLPFKMTSLGLGNVRAEGETPYFRGASELAEFWRLSWGRVRDAVAQTGTDITQWDRELAELDDPTRLFVSPMTIAVIATKA